MGDGKQDRRAFERVAHELPIEYATLNQFFSDYTRNIGRGGTFIRTDEPLPCGTELKFRLQLPTVDDGVELRGIVRWIITEDAASNDQPAGMGIAFVYASEAERDRMHARIESIMRDRLGPAAAVLLDDA